MSNKTRQTFIVEYIFLTTLLESDLFILFLLLSWSNISHWHIKEAQTIPVAYSYIKSAKQCLPKDKLSSFISSFSKQITSHKLCQNPSSYLMQCIKIIIAASTMEAHQLTSSQHGDSKVLAWASHMNSAFIL